MNLADLKAYAEAHERSCPTWWNANIPCDCDFRKAIGKLVKVAEAAMSPGLIDSGFRGEHDEDALDDLRDALAALEAE